MPKTKLPPFQRARQPKQIEQRREAILHAALVLFQKKGLENVALADIADRVGTAGRRPRASLSFNPARRTLG